MADAKEWFVGAPDFRDSAFTLTELQQLIRDKKVFGTDLVRQSAGMWKTAQDFDELKPLFEEPEDPSGPVRPNAPTAKLPRPPLRFTQKGPRQAPPAAPQRRETGPRPARPATATPTPAPPPLVSAPEPQVASHESEAPSMSELPPAELSPSAQADPPPAAGEEPASEEPAAEARPKKSGRLAPVPEPVFAVLEHFDLGGEDLVRGIWKIFRPATLGVGLVMGIVSVLLAGLFKGSPVAASFVFFPVFSIFHAAACFMTRSAFDEGHGLAMVKPYLLKSAGTLIGIAAALLPAAVSLGLGIAYEVKEDLATFTLLIAVSVVFLVMAVVWVGTGGYLNAILAVEVCSPGRAASALLGLWKNNWRVLLPHSIVSLVLAFAAFLIGTLPALGISMMNFGGTNQVPMGSVVMALDFGIGMTLALSTLGTVSVLSYLNVRPKLAADQSSETAGRKPDTTKIEVEPEPAQPEAESGGQEPPVQ